MLRRAVRLVWQSAPGWTLTSLVLLIVQGLLPLASLYLLKLIVDAVTTALKSSQPNFNHTLWLIVAMGAVTLAGAIASSLAALVNEVQAQSVTDYMASVIHAKSVQADLAYYENSQYYDTLHRAQQEAPYRPTHIVNGLMQVGQSSVALIALVGLLLSLHWIVAAVLLLAAVPGMLVRLRYSQQLYAWQHQRTSSERQASYIQLLLTSEAHAKEMRLFNLGELFIQRYRDLRTILRNERMRLVSHRSRNELITQSVGTLATFGALAYIAYQTVLGTLTLGDLVMYYQAFQRGQAYLQNVVGGLASLYEDSLFLTNLYEFLDMQPRIVEPTSPRPLSTPLRQGIAFEHVRFGYGASDQPVLDDITLTIRPGEHIALVGENGAGKTTLVKLLCRLYDPSAGRITLDGVDLREFGTKDLRRQISVVFQDYAHYQLSARENIWLGNTASPPDDGKIAAAAHAAGAEALIDNLPHGYDTKLGNWFDGGHELSIGQWQKIALARAFFRDAQIIVLDEPTSALDAAAEYEVFQQFRHLATRRTAVLISHRFSTVRMADRIYLLANGRITEAGSHVELMRQDGEYARLFELQAGNYR
ncbi:MAG: ABC transporter ATP-binding protein [Chloroflexi bacterium RBG_19FT_COMBO_49_13]|nr:MAG: ABC transporter ATP-binding protein [Chloroflexi bacterium RBG_19FT_COMBO_49_13]